MARILVVDDDPADRKPLKRLLEREGFEVITAGDASIALAAVSRCVPDLILLDISIPRVDGLTYLWRLRESLAGRHIPVIVVTGHEEPEMIKRAKDLGVLEYLVKSQFTPAELIGLVRMHTLGAGAPETTAGSADVASS